MTPKEKAIELVATFRPFAHANWNEVIGFHGEMYNAKQCAINCIDEMIVQNGELYLLGLAKDYYIKRNNFLFEVKSEIEKL